eukprot:230859-Pyramimonas_sp.AAC.2
MARVLSTEPARVFIIHGLARHSRTMTKIFYSLLIFADGLAGWLSRSLPASIGSLVDTGPWIRPSGGRRAGVGVRPRSITRGRGNHAKVPAPAVGGRARRPVRRRSNALLHAALRGGAVQQSAQGQLVAFQAAIPRHPRQQVWIIDRSTSATGVHVCSSFCFLAPFPGGDTK